MAAGTDLGVENRTSDELEKRVGDLFPNYNVSSLFVIRDDNMRDSNNNVITKVFFKGYSKISVVYALIYFGRKDMSSGLPMCELIKKKPHEIEPEHIGPNSLKEAYKYLDAEVASRLAKLVAYGGIPSFFPKMDLRDYRIQN
jgi:hypothetical protein